MYSNKTNSNNSQEGWKFLVICFGIVILVIIAYLSLSKFSSLGTTPVNVGLWPDGSDLARVMYETGTLIVGVAALILAAYAFVVPFTIHMWSEMSDSFFELSLKVIGEDRIGNNLRKQIIGEISQTMNQFKKIQQDVRMALQVLIIFCFIAMVLLALLAIGTIFCWNIVQYLWLRALLFIICVVIAFGLFFLIMKFMRIKPEITKRRLQLQIMEALSFPPAGQQNVQEDKQNAGKQK